MGRSGRDGKPARSVIFYGEADLAAKKPEVHQSMIEFIRNSNSRCLRDMLLSYLGDTLARRPALCCGYCNYGSMNLESLLAHLEIDEDKTLNGTKPAPKARQPPAPKELKEKLNRALEDFRYKKAMSLPEGALIHGIDSVIFGDEAINRIVKGMKTISEGKDVINLTGGMIYHYADEIAELVGEIRLRDAVEKARQSAAKRKAK